MAFRNGPQRLAASGQGQFLTDSCTIQIGPTVRGEVWNIERTIVSTDSPSDTTCMIYRGVVSDVNLIEGTYSGNQDVTDSQIEVVAPEFLTVVWTNGTVSNPPHIATVRVEGERSFRLTR